MYVLDESVFMNEYRVVSRNYVDEMTMKSPVTYLWKIIMMTKGVVPHS